MLSLNFGLSALLVADGHPDHVQVFLVELCRQAMTDLRFIELGHLFFENHGVTIGCGFKGITLDL